MSEILFMVRDGEYLRPASKGDAEILAKIPNRRAMTIQISTPRNKKLDQKFWALMRTATEASEYYPRPRDLANKLLEVTGRYDVITDEEGNQEIKVHSLKHGNMDGLAFEAFYYDCLTIIKDKILPRVTDDEIAEELRKFLP